MQIIKDLCLIVLIILAINWTILPIKMDKTNTLLKEILEELKNKK